MLSESFHGEGSIFINYGIVPALLIKRLDQLGNARMESIY
jgi:hypothetical protein